MSAVDAPAHSCPFSSNGFISYIDQMQGTTPVLAKEVKKYKQTDGIHEMDLISTEIVNHEKMNSTYNLERTLTLWAWVT